MDRDSLIKYILKFSTSYKSDELEKMNTQSLVILKVQIEIEQSKKLRTH